jgi:hypothetical protein
MELFTAHDMTHLPQSVVSIKSKNGLSASSSNGSTPVVEFEIGGSLGFYLAEDVVLSFDFQYTASDGVVYNLRPQNAGGIANMVRQIDIYSIQDGVLLESISDYHILNSVLMSHNNGSDLEVQDGSFKKWSLTECYTNDYQERTPFVSPNSYPASPTDLVADQTYQSQKIQMPLRLSHLLSASQVIPVSALGGLRVRLQLNRPEIFTINSGWEVDEAVLIDVATPAEGNPVYVIDDQNNTLTFGGVDYVVAEDNYATMSAVATAITTAIQAQADIEVSAFNATPARITFSNTTEADIDLTGTLMTGFFTAVATAPATGDVDCLVGEDAISTATDTIYLKQVGLHLNNPLDLSTCPFKVGQRVKVESVGALDPAISNISVVAVGEDAYIALTFEDDVELPVITDLIHIQTFVPADTQVEYALSNISLLVPIITPPPSYVSQLASAIASADGMVMDIKSYALVRNTIMKGQTLASLQLPFTSSRAKGLITIPHITNAGSFLSRYACDNMSMLNLTKYFYDYMGVKHPEQGIDCEQARQGSLSQELIVEQSKSFEYTLARLASLDGYSSMYKSKSFFLGRNLGIFNSVMDTRPANISLTLEATSSDGGVLAGYTASSLSVHTYCSSMYALVMRPAGVMVMK